MAAVLVPKPGFFAREEASDAEDSDSEEDVSATE
jgi:hypothetical protein